MVTCDGRPAAVILSPDDLESLEGTVAVLADHDVVRQLPTTLAWDACVG